MANEYKTKELTFSISLAASEKNLEPGWIAVVNCAATCAATVKPVQLYGTKPNEACNLRALRDALHILLDEVEKDIDIDKKCPDGTE